MGGQVLAWGWLGPAGAATAVTGVSRDLFRGAWLKGPNFPDADFAVLWRHFYERPLCGQVAGLEQQPDADSSFLIPIQRRRPAALEVRNMH